MRLPGTLVPMEPTLRADRFAILTAPAVCHACNALMAVSALLVPAYLERHEDDDEWIAVDESALLTYVEAVDETTRSGWTARAPQIRLAASRAAGRTYLANVCACGALQGDWYLTEPDGPFFPLSDAGVAAIGVDWIEAPIEAHAGASRSNWTDALIARFPFPGWLPPPPPKARRQRR